MIIQPPNSKLCGHCCLATILNISLQESIKLIGHEKGTKTKELITHFNHGKLKRGFPTVKSLCICWHQTLKTNHWHWILYKPDEIYDPNIGVLEKSDYFNLFPYRISSHIPII